MPSHFRYTFRTLCIKYPIWAYLSTKPPGFFPRSRLFRHFQQHSYHYTVKLAKSSDCVDFVRRIFRTILLIFRTLCAILPVGDDCMNVRILFITSHYFYPLTALRVGHVLLTVQNFSQQDWYGQKAIFGAKQFTTVSTISGQTKNTTVSLTN